MQCRVEDEGCAAIWSTKVTDSVTTLPHIMQRWTFNVGKPPARGRATMNFKSAPHCSHVRAGGLFFSSLSMLQRTHARPAE
jgi:hypothetical protein